jgi:methanogenic corrinoid protein MtbC1
MAILNDISAKLQEGKAKEVRALIEQALAEGVGAKAILEEGLLPGMSIIGEKFKNNEVYVPEVLISARAMKAGTDILKPYLAEANVQPLGKICIGTVKGDLHDIGKNLVKMMMEGKGIEVVDLGVDVSPEQFLAAVKDEGCQIVCCSALLTTTMGVMKDVVDIFVKEGIRDTVKIMIGGAPITDAYCKSIGADGYTADAASAADLAVEFLKA